MDNQNSMDKSYIIWITLYAGVFLLSGEYSHSQKSQCRHYVHDMEEQRAINPTEEKTCSINDLADNELRFRDMDQPKVSTEHDQRL